jgi:ATP-dependent protease HslVU (ClpYQ) ATPase subunit
MEELLEDISFNANGRHPEIEVLVDEKYVADHVKSDVQGKALEKYII